MVGTRLIQVVGRVSPEYREEEAPLTGGEAGLVNGAACGSTLDDNGAYADAALDPIATNELGWTRWCAGGMFAEERAVVAQNVVRESGMAAWRHGIEAVREHSDRDASAVERTLMGGCVNAKRETADHREAAFGEVAGNSAGYTATG